MEIRSYKKRQYFMKNKRFYKKRLYFMKNNVYIIYKNRIYKIFKPISITNYYNKIDNTHLFKEILDS